MSTKEERQNKIREIITSEKIDSQDALLTRLKESGIDITQATLSRDLKSLGASRISDGWSNYYYSFPSNNKEGITRDEYIKAVHFGVRSIEFSGNFGVIKTRIGHANSVAAALDYFNIPEILGTIAGDDTIFIVLREGCAKEDLIESFKSQIPDISKEA